MSRRVITRTPHRINVVLHHEDSNGRDWNQNESMRLLKTSNPAPQQDRFLETVKELDQLIGLDKVKDFVYEIYSLLYIQKMP